MRFAITASDRYMGVFDAFLKAGWEPIRLFSSHTDGRMFRTSGVIERAQQLKIGVQLSRMNERDLKVLADDGCEILIVASYQWRIGDWQKHLPYAINFHPSLLPDYRGPYPLVNGLLAREPRWGATCHRLAADFDTGDILAQRAFEVAADETHDSLDLKTQMAANHIARQVAADFPALWKAARPQSGGSYARLFTDAQRTIDFNDTVEQILVQVRAFGRFECIATINGIRVNIARAAGWREVHAVKAGTVVHTYALATVVACRDGYIAVMDWHLFESNIITGTPGR